MDIITALLNGILNWPFLMFILVIFVARTFREEIRERLSQVSEFQWGEYGKIIIGTKEVPISEIGSALTDALSELEKKVEELEARKFSEVNENQLRSASDASDGGEIPDGLKDQLWDRVNEMLNSRYYYARYIDTLAKNTSVSPDLMENFLQSRPEVKVFDDGVRRVAALKNRPKLEKMKKR